MLGSISLLLQLYFQPVENYSSSESNLCCVCALNFLWYTLLGGGGGGGRGVTGEERRKRTTDLLK